MCRPSASGVHATCGDYRSIGIERITAGEVIDGRWVMLWRHPLYGRWRRIIERAAWKSPSMLRHGNNAVSYSHCTVCDEWLNFTNFARWAMVNGYRRELQIDRIDNEKGYSPDNCRWVTPSVQNRNRRMTEKWREAMRRNAAKGRAAQAARRAAAKAAREGVAV